MRKPKLHTDEQNALTVRTFIASTTEIITKSDIADGFGISRMTMYRYESPQLQEKNRYDSRTSYQAAERNPLNCRICKKPLLHHDRCSICTILLHDTKTRCVGKSRDMIYCIHCE